MKFAEPLIFEDKSLQDAKKILGRRERKISEVVPSSLRMIYDDSGLYLEHRNGSRKVYHVRESFYYKLLRWYNVSYKLIRLMSPETSVSLCNDFLNRIKSGKVRIITDNNEAISITSDKYTDISDLEILGICSELGIEKVSRNDFFIRIYGRIKEKTEPVKGDICGLGFNIISSDTGFRRISVESYVLRYICSNGAVISDKKNRESISHYGTDKITMLASINRNINEIENNFRVLGERLKKMKDKKYDTYMSKIKRGIEQTTGNGTSKRILEDISLKTEKNEIKNLYDLFNYITNLAKNYGQGTRYRIEELAGSLISADAE